MPVLSAELPMQSGRRSVSRILVSICLGGSPEAGMRPKLDNGVIEMIRLLLHLTEG